MRAHIQTYIKLIISEITLNKVTYFNIFFCIYLILLIQPKILILSKSRLKKIWIQKTIFSVFIKCHTKMITLNERNFIAPCFLRISTIGTKS